MERFRLNSTCKQCVRTGPETALRAYVDVLMPNRRFIRNILNSMGRKGHVSPLVLKNETVSVSWDSVWHGGMTRLRGLMSRYCTNACVAVSWVGWPVIPTCPSAGFDVSFSPYTSDRMLCPWVRPVIDYTTACDRHCVGIQVDLHAVGQRGARHQRQHHARNVHARHDRVCTRPCDLVRATRHTYRGWNGM